MTTPDNPYQSPAADVVVQRELATGHQLMPARRVRAKRGAAWVGEAFSGATSGTAGWILFALVFGVIYLPFAVAPVLLEGAGIYAMIPVWFLYYPLVSMWWGGAMLGCHPGAFRFARAWRGMLASWQPTLWLGIYVGFLSLPGIVVSAMLGFLGGDQTVMMEQFARGPAFLATLTLGFALYYSLLMLAFWFATPLVVLGGVAPGRALLLSAKAALRNTLPILVFGLVVIALFFAVIILLGIAMAVVMGVTGLTGTMMGEGGGSFVLIASALGALVYALLAVGMLAVSCQAQYSSYLDVFGYGQAQTAAGDASVNMSETGPDQESADLSAAQAD